ncbi:hypothetical protein LMG26696_00355 [Achromobacter pulmonis]|uniref:helix-turn-helix transcriptional regulator n=1 Tax=Achromobacter pulmonis TaxID=1389932 RepID=UPI0014686F3B|nr:AraC family transcriptional regulator [Achromobacter pulmonis]CAB3627745.1 hypothetical protein LMG26696_00355 [Achromobacter pulmonis]
MKFQDSLPPSAARALPEASTTALCDPDYVARLLPEQQHKLVCLPAGDGVELCYWQSVFDQPLTARVRDAGDRVILSYQLRGTTHCWLEGGPAGGETQLRETSGSIFFAPDRRGHFCQQGLCESLSVAVRPDVLRKWLGHDTHQPLERSLALGSCLHAGYRGEKLHQAALAVSRDLKHLPPRSNETRGTRLIREAQALTLAGLFLEDEYTTGARGNAATPHRQRLLAARDYLLADLAHPPTLARIAAETGLSAMRIKRGFRELFGHSVYGLFQQERMRDAQRRLRAGGVTVMEVAFDLGYSNPSHFAAAFRKEFGLGPGEFKRRAAGA